MHYEANSEVIIDPHDILETHRMPGEHRNLLPFIAELKSSSYQTLIERRGKNFFKKINFIMPNHIIQPNLQFLCQINGQQI